MSQPPENPGETIRHLNESFQLYSEKFSKQFHLKIPKDVVKRVSHYRDTYFAYLKDSVYKSNICYLLQLVDYQLWLYRLFRPALSLENAYFYQLMVTMGIVAEALSAAILIDPLLEEDSKDRSLGEAKEENSQIAMAITRNNFTENLKIAEKLEILPRELIHTFQEFRRSIRNLVHIQNWEGRLYESLEYNRFREVLDGFRKFLGELKTNIDLSHSPADLERALFGHDFLAGAKRHQGVIVQFNPRGGFGFIKSGKGKRQIYFHASQLGDIKESQIKDNLKVTFKYKIGQRGYEAADILLQGGAPHE